MEGSRVRRSWEGDDLSQLCLESWEKFVSKDHNFPEKALPARFIGAPDLGDFRALLFHGQTEDLNDTSIFVWLHAKEASGQ